jgi:hypothetical protein
LIGFIVESITGFWEKLLALRPHGLLSNIHHDTNCASFAPSQLPGLDSVTARCLSDLNIEKSHISQKIFGTLGPCNYGEICNFIHCELCGSPADGNIDLWEMVHLLDELPQNQRMHIMHAVAARCYDENYLFGCSGLGLLASLMPFSEETAKYENVVLEFVSVWREEGEAARKKRDAELSTAYSMHAPPEELDMSPEQRLQHFLHDSRDL